MAAICARRPWDRNWARCGTARGREAETRGWGAQKVCGGLFDPAGAQGTMCVSWGWHAWGVSICHACKAEAVRTVGSLTYRPWRLPAPGAESAQAAAAVGVPLTHTRCTGPCAAGWAVPGHGGDRHCPHSSCWCDLQHHLPEHSVCSKMLSLAAGATGALQVALRALLGAMLVLLAVPAGPCGRWARGSAECAGAAAGRGEGSEACSALSMCRQRAGTVTHCSAPACSGTCVGSKRARWAAMPRQCAGKGGQCAGKVHGAVP